MKRFLTIALTVLTATTVYGQLNLPRVENRAWTWTKLNWAPCSKVGTNATAAFEVSAIVKTWNLYPCQHDHDDGITIEAYCSEISDFIVNVRCGVSKFRINGYLLITHPGKRDFRIQLSEPPATIGREGIKSLIILPSTETSDDNYFKYKNLSLPEFSLIDKCTTLKITISIIADLPSGVCNLGLFTHTIDF